MRKKLTGLADASRGLIEDSAACEKCGAIIGLAEGTCLHCFLGEGLESEGEASCEAFQSVLAEADVPDKHWHLGQYEILEEIGRGGMGVIYRARQRHSRRIVALKRILSYQANSNETLVRFRREAEAVAALDHPNIVPIYEVSESEDGLPFFSMKYATGGSLRSAAPGLRVTPQKSVRLLAKVARAVAYAHDKGILHRDLQPGNILLDGNGDPLVSDFGLAKLLDAGSDLTRTLTTFGTPGFIAPEQAESAGGDLAPTADVYSLGAILCYLLAGRPPFVGANVLSVIHQAAATPAPRLRALVPSLDRDLETIVARCLEREPQARYQSAAALAEDLERWLEGRPVLARRVLPPAHIWRWARRNPVLAVAATTCLLLAVAVIWLLGGHAPPVAISEKSIAVLPFENLSRDPENAYFADGIQDEILTRLSKISDLKVISRTSTETYKNAPRNLRQIAQQLGVSNILEGRIQKSADQIRVTVQLINAVTDSHLWAESYDRKFSDIFQVESDVAQKIAASLEAKLTGREKRDISSIGTQNPQAYEAYLRGLTAGRPFDYDSWQRAVQAFEDAVRADPQFAKAWASLGWLRARIYFQDFDRTEATRVAVGKAVQTAMRLDPELAEAQMASGFYEYYVVGDYDTARRMFEQVRSRWPNNADIVATLGLIAFRQGRWTEGREYLDEAIALSPRDSFLREEAASTRASARDFPGALRTINQALAIWPDSTNLIAIEATVYQALGELDQADALLSGLHPGAKDLAALGAICYQAMLRRDPAPAITLLRTLNDSSHSLPPLLQARYHVLLGRLVQLSGNTNETHASFTQARQILEKELQRQPQNPLLASLLAQTLAGVGDRDAALRQADRAVELLASSRDARDGPHYEAMRARIQARFGDGNRAIPTLKHLLQTPYSAWPGSLLTPALLRLDPDFDQLRSDPRFQELVASPAPK